ncbi:GDYXXLXY domain-containing protein [Acinetobacter sp. ANC 3832]|uniref:GDYXXLXY domain-containing protein n=1 Tax=Acinetobacter sp. ANC 3832 TaxID=1977874 RepID=UPI000A32F70A|nr:GDYXXLXY domain-containing protein [Acinetobacter sp. ANC 3832]OTG93844.1 GDYXXLXY protein [Acinetobacter sp. ANC 3832]
MKKFIPLLIAIISIVLFTGMIMKNEMHLKNSQSIYIQLKPVDPRSLIQGDYMQLNYELFFAPHNSDQVDLVFSGGHFDELIQNKPKVTTFVELDERKRVIHTSFTQLTENHTEKLVLRNPDNRYTSLYPASQSFLFAEGLAECYAQAQYAEFKVDREGNAILAALKGQNLQDLGCEYQKSWWQ